ncbi:LysM peptidoglycan-binding domain-containing protein [Streptomyces sp. NPDC057694]|uniref:LysM peptidoglycan-binding domain-containing protein n=1 Tax=Streptomyces sp. NPDC057694 TaxID=3346216 RepID=UPI00369B1426
MPPTTRRATSWPRALARGLFALTILALLVVGVPILLLNIGTLPSSMPDIGSWQDALTLHDDDGTGLMSAMTLIAWVLWLWLTVPVLVETVAVLARRTTPRLPGMATGQKLAGFLLGSIILASPAAASAATPAAAATPITAHSVPGQTAGTDTGTGVASRASTDIAAPGPNSRRVTVAEDATWWELAEQLLGDGTHFEQLQRLNAQLTPADGVIPAGTQLHAPATSTAPVTSNAVQAQAGFAPQTAHDNGNSHQMRVKPGDSLWSIAEEELGDPTLYPKIAEANQDVIEDPDLIYPGEQLSIPDQATDAPAPPRTQEPSSPKPPTSPQGDAGSSPAPSETPSASDGEAGTPEQESSSPSVSDSAPDRETPSDEADQDDAGIGVPTQAAPTHDPSGKSTTTPSAPQTSTPAQQSTAPRAGDETAGPAETVGEAESSPAAMVGALGAAGFIAAGVLVMLRRRRTVQQRRRRRGRRIPMPQGRAASTEHALRCEDAIEEIGFLDTALRTLAHHCAEAGQPLPVLAAIQLGAEGALLHLANGDDELPAPLTPFNATADSPRVWWCPVDTSDLLDAELRGQMDAPYPALVALGDDTGEALLLVDLEQFGAVHLTGALRLPVLRALGTSLAVSPLSSDLEIAVAGEDSAPGLSIVDPRVTPYPTLADAADVVRAHHQRQHAALSGSASTDLHAARAADALDELWPMVVLADLDTCPDPESAELLTQALEQEPRTATAIITSGQAPAGQAGTVWVLDTDADIHAVPGTDLACRLVAFSNEEYADVIETVLTSLSETDVAPDLEATQAPVALSKTEVPVSAEPPRPATDTAATGQTGSLLSRLADLDDTPPANANAAEQAAPQPAPPIEVPAPANPQADATSPSRIVLPATTPVTSRVSARLRDPEPTPPPPAPPGPVRESAAVPAAASVDADSSSAGADGHTSTPMVRVLGPVDIAGAGGHIDSNRRTVATELITWLALRPNGATRHELDEVIAAGGGRVENNTRNARVREVRRWLGDEHYPKLNEQPDRRHRLIGVGCDWWQFQDLAGRAAHADDEGAVRLLRDALALVKGRPFTGIPPRRYAWAQILTEEMISAVADAADDLATRCLKSRDPRSALWAAGRGLDAGREREVLWRHRFEALAALGAHDELEQAIQQLTQYLLDADLTMETETEAVIRRLDAVRR